MTSYRERVYKDYAAAFQDAKPAFDEVAQRRWGRAYDYYFRNWLPEKKDAAIVDLACGGGRLLFFFKERGYANLMGVDVSPSQIQLARQVVPNVVEASALDFLEAHPQRFDLITGLDVAEHFTKDEFLRFLDGCRSALKPGGRLIIQTVNGDSPWVNSIYCGDFTHETCLNPNSLTRLLKLCGFASIESREMGPPLGYSMASTVRALLWQFVRWKWMVLNYIETGQRGSGVFTRILSVSGVSK